MALPLSPQVFVIFSHLIEETAGLHYSERESELLAEKLTVRATELELESLLDYYYFLKYDEGGPRELDALIDALVVNETYFYREADQLRAMVDRLLLPMAQADATRRFRVWCAAASTGEEPYTLAMMLDERELLDKVDLLATDISPRTLSKAATRTYSGRSLRALGDGDRRRHFVEVEGGAVRVRTELARAIQWRRLNLMDESAIHELGRFDFILCRNVLIYFQDETVLRLVERFARALTPDGVLLVGASESLLRFGTVFDCEEHAGAFYYRKSPGTE